MTEFGAEEHLRAIRLLMERATIYRAISAPTALVGGLLSVFTAAAMLLWQIGGSGRNIDAHFYFAAWMLVFIVTLAANTFFIWRGAHQRGEPLISPGMKLALRAITPSLFAGGAISACLSLTSNMALIPTLFWPVFYGLGLLSTMSFAPRSIVALGWAFLFTGIGFFIYFMNQTLLPEVELPTPTRFYPAAMMGLTFGLYHLVYAAFTWTRHSQVLDAIESRPLVTHEPPFL
jgi:hypothetical protein